MNEVSKLGQPEEEPIEGRIVSPYEGPLMTDGLWDFLNNDLLRARNMYRANTIQVSGDGENWTNVGTGGVSYSYGVDPAGPDVTLGWLDGLHNLHTQTITTSFTVDDMDPQAFRLLTGYDYDVLRVVQKSPWTEPATVPAVDPAKVRWMT